MMRVRLRDDRFLVGPSRWGAGPGLLVTLDLPRAAARSVDAHVATLVAAVPELAHLSPRSRRARPPRLPEILVALADAMSEAAGIAWGPSAHGDDDGRAWMLLASPRANVGRALARGLEAILGAPPDAPFDAIGATLRALVDAWDVPIETGRLAGAARAAGVPTRFLDDDGGSLLLGAGARRRIYHFHAFADPHGVDAIAEDKVATTAWLRAAGIPCTHPVRVSSATEAVRAARAIGYPVVVKPSAGWQQMGVFPNLASDDAVRLAFRAARRGGGPLGRDLLVEEHRAGRYVRATVIGGGIESVAASTIPHVRGDGVSTVEQLTCRAEGMPPGTRLPMRGRGILDAALLPQGLARSSVPERGARVAVGLSSHCAFTNLTERANASLRDVILRVAALFPVPAMGIDLLVRSPRAGFDPRTDVVLEVNTRAMLYVGSPSRDVAGAVLRHLYPLGARDASVPVVLAPPGGDAAILALGRRLARAGVCTAGYASESLWWREPSNVVGRGPDASRLVALDPDAEVLLVALDAHALDAIGVAVPPARHVLAAGRWPHGVPPARFTAGRAASPESPAAILRRLLATRTPDARKPRGA